MSYEEIQKAIEGMLAVQRELQESQLKFKDQIDRLIDYQENNGRQIGQLAVLMQNLATAVTSHDQRIEQLEQNS